MNLFTNSVMKIVPFLTVLVFNIPAEAKSSQKDNTKVDVKCFVELVGGEETVSFWNIPTHQVSNLINTVVGQKVSIPHSKQKGIIYKANECVLLKDNFSGNKAKMLDDKIAR